jgi:hypothetical protein
MFDHTEGIAAFLVQAHNRIGNRVQQRAVHPRADFVQKNETIG